MPKEHELHQVAHIDEIPVGERKIIDVAGRSIGIFNIAGKYVAFLNYCPHEKAPVCLGQVRGTTLFSQPGEYEWGHQGSILACPWHGWEFNLLTGECLVDRRKLHQFTVEVQNGLIFVQI